MRTTSPVRMKKVHEGRMIWNGLPRTMKRLERIHELFIYRYSIEDGFSLKEFSLIMNQKHPVGTSKSGAPRPLEKSIKSTRRWLCFFTKWARNMAIVIAPQVNEKRESIYYNVQNRSQLREYEQFVLRSTNGALENLEIKKAIIQKGRKARVQIAESTSEEIMITCRRRKKKAVGDFTA
jgi:hypothetical protein